NFPYLFVYKIFVPKYLFIALLIFYQFIILLSIYFYNYKGKNYGIGLFIISLTITLMIFIATEKKIEARNLYKNPLEKEVSFFYGDKLIISDCDKVFLGKTSDYIFLRNFERKENYI